MSSIETSPGRKVREVPQRLKEELEEVQEILHNARRRRQALVLMALEQGASKNQVALLLGIDPHRVDTIISPQRNQT